MWMQQGICYKVQSNFLKIDVFTVFVRRPHPLPSHKHLPRISFGSIVCEVQDAPNA